MIFGGLSRILIASVRWLAGGWRRSQARPAPDFWRDVAAGADPAQEIIVLSGPEGGLTADEEGAAVARGFVRVGLGPRVLRADTAPLAFLAWLGLQANAQRGDMP